MQRLLWSDRVAASHGNLPADVQRRPVSPSAQQAMWRRPSRQQTDLQPQPLPCFLAGRALDPGMITETRRQIQITHLFVWTGPPSVISFILGILLYCFHLLSFWTTSASPLDYHYPLWTSHSSSSGLFIISFLLNFLFFPFLLGLGMDISLTFMFTVFSIMRKRDSGSPGHVFRV